MNYYRKNDYSKAIQATAITFGLCTLLYMSSDNKYSTKEQSKNTAMKNNIEAILVPEEKIFENKKPVAKIPLT